jgi:hypothetical protein
MSLTLLYIRVLPTVRVVRVRIAAADHMDAYGLCNTGAAPRCTESALQAQMALCAPQVGEWCIVAPCEVTRSVFAAVAQYLERNRHAVVSSASVRDELFTFAECDHEELAMDLQGLQAAAGAMMSPVRLSPVRMGLPHSSCC